MGNGNNVWKTCLFNVVDRSKRSERLRSVTFMKCQVKITWLSKIVWEITCIGAVYLPRYKVSQSDPDSLPVHLIKALCEKVAPFQDCVLSFISAEKSSKLFLGKKFGNEIISDNYCQTISMTCQTRNIGNENVLKKNHQNNVQSTNVCMCCNLL